MKRSEMTQISTYHKGTLYGHNIDNILERHYGRTAYVCGAGTDYQEIVVDGYSVDRIVYSENMRSRNNELMRF